MNEEINILEATESVGPESEEQLALNFLESLRIHAADKFDKPTFALFKDGIGFAPLGNIMAICAEAKNGKSWLMLQFAVAILRGEFCGLTSEMESPTVLYFDTEQDKYDTKNIMNRVHYCCNWDYRTDNPQFQLYSMDVFDCLKKDKDIQENRLIAIETAISVYSPKVVFIDGVRDLIHDFNDLGQSADLVQRLMSIARNKGCLIVTVLHVNPNSDKMRGHLGTEMQNKTTDVITVKKEDQGGLRVFKVHQVAARHQDIEDWIFWINDNGKWAIPEVYEDAEVVRSTPTQQGPTNDEIEDALNENLSQGEVLSKTSLRERIRINRKVGSTRAGEIIDRGVNLGLLLKDGNKFRLNNATVTDDDPF